MFKLVIADEEGSTTVVPLVRDEVSVGRREGNTIRLTERNVSRRHAIFRKNGAGLTVEDLDSYNGVKVNGKKIDGSAALQAGDQVSVGDYIIALQEEVAAGATQITPAPASTGAPEIPRLVMLGPPSPGEEFFLGADMVRIGRGEEQDAWINHRSMSREHAEIFRRDDGFYVRDCGSQNGVRVNGDDIREVRLGRGDIVELGEVRFRYVAPGEHYHFDADMTMQVAALPFEDDKRRSNRRISLMILAIGLPLALALALTGGEEANQNIAVANQPVAGESNRVEPAAAPAEPIEELEEAAGSDAEETEAAGAVSLCERSLGELRAADAVGHADVALGLSPGLAEAVSCRGEAVALMRDEEHYLAGKRALEGGDADGAVSAFAMLAENSPYRAQPELAQAQERIREDRLTSAERALAASNWSEAERLAASVIALEGTSTSQISRARGLQRSAQEGADRAEAALAAARVQPSRPVASNRPAANPRMERRPRAAAPAMSSAMSPAMSSASGGNPCPLTLGLREMQACQCRLARRGHPRFARLIAQGRCR